MCVTLTTIGSGSSGNGYILTCGENKLILEAGCKKEEYLKALNYDLNNVRGILCTHAHLDHSRSLDRLMDYGLQAYAPFEVSTVYPRCKVIKKYQRYNICGFIVLPLKVPHGNCEECFAYYITMPDGQTLLFCTDAETLPYRLPNVNTLMIEANFSEELIIDRLCEGQDIRSHYNAHMELNETIKVIKRLNNPNLNKVILIHLSSGNSDEQMFKDRIFSETGVRCDIAHACDVFELKISEF